MSNAIFKEQIANNVNTNVIDLPHRKKLTCNMGELIPILCEEVLPGDTWQHNTELMLRMAPMTAPVMHEMNVYTHFFFVPNRIIWEDFEDFITGGEDGDDATVHPYIDLLEDGNLVDEDGSLADYLGAQFDLNSAITAGTINSLPFRAYTTIWNEYYRDQNLQDEINVSTGNGEETTTGILQVRNRCWEKDYFTAALPWTQKGDEVILPLGTSAPLQQSTTGVETTEILNSTGTKRTDSGDLQMTTGDLTANTYASRIDISSHTNVDLTSATAATINELRLALATQRWLEKNARVGSRYTEYLLGHYNVRSADARLQRPEFLGGGMSPIQISEVLQTAESGTTPQGNMSGHGISIGNSHRFKKYFTEHGYIIGIMSVMPKPIYHQGVRRHFLKTDKFDYYHPSFAHIGEQPVYAAELFGTATNLDAYNTHVFGYQPRYSEYKYIPNTIHGQFRTTELHWTMVRDFDEEPSLNATFVDCSHGNYGNSLHQIFADTSSSVHKIYVQLYNNTRAIRKMPLFVRPHI